MASNSGARLMARVDMSAGLFGCWLWTGGLNDGGYGRVSIAGRYERVHRYVYRTLVGPIPVGLGLDHTCHSNDPTCPGGLCVHRRCVNPAHLEPTDDRTNVLRGRGLSAEAARRTHCLKGHPYSGENLRIEPDGDRRCLTCRRASEAGRPHRVRSRSVLRLSEAQTDGR